MADEFRHKDVGDELTKAEWEAVATHIANSQAAGDIIYCDGSYWKRLAKGTNGLYLKCAAVPYWEAILEADIPASICRDAELAAHTADKDAHHSNVAGLTFIIDGGGAEITTGLKMGLEIPFACTISVATLIGVLPADTNGSIVIDVWKTTYAAAPPKDANSITAAAPPTITTAKKSQDSTLTGWTTAIAAGDILFVNVDSITTFTAVTLSLKVTKT